MPNIPPKPRSSSAATLTATSTTPGVYAHLDKLSADYNHAAKEEVRRQTHEANYWKEQAKNKDEEIRRLQQSVQGRDRALQQAGQQREALERQANDFRKTNNGLLADSERTVKPLRMEKAELDKDVGELAQQHAGKVAELEQATTQLAKQEHVAKAVQKVVELRKKKEAIKKDWITERNAAEDLRTHLAERQMQVESLEDEVNAHIDKESKIQDELSRLRQIESLMDGQLAEAKKSMERLSADKKRAEANHIEESKAHKRTREKHDKEREAAKELKKWSDERRERIEELEPEVDRLRTELMSEKEASTRTNSQYADLQIKLKNTEVQLEATKKECAVYEETVSRVISSISSLAGPALTLSTSLAAPPQQTARHNAGSGLVGQPPITPISPNPHMPPPPVPALQPPWSQAEMPVSDLRRRSSENSYREGAYSGIEPRGTKRMSSPELQDKPPPCGPKAWRRSHDVYRP